MILFPGFTLKYNACNECYSLKTVHCVFIHSQSAEKRNENEKLQYLVFLRTDFKIFSDYKMVEVLWMQCINQSTANNIRNFK